MTAISNEELYEHMRRFLTSHTDEIIEQCKDCSFTWNNWKRLVDPLIKISDVLLVDAEELKRANQAYIDAQAYLIHVKQSQILKLKEASRIIRPQGKKT